MRIALLAFVLFTASCMLVRGEPAAESNVNVSKLPAVPDPNFSFRKTKIFTLTSQPGVTTTRTPKPGQPQKAKPQGQSARQAVQEASMNFERSYRLYGAVDGADQRQRFGQYFDFFWRSKRPADVTVRFEYKQEKLRAFTQARQIAYRDVRGTNKSEFRIIGDEFLDDGKVLAWRCLLIEHGRIVAEKRSFLWD